MKTYQCHKRVKAARIVDVTAQPGGGVELDIDNGTRFSADAAMVARYTPVIGDYLVEYEDGYRSISPRKAFEDGYALAGDLPTRVTLADMEARIASTEFMVIPGSTVTICHITLDNGYSVRGESACVDPANFDKEIGERIAREQAINKLWPLFGFLLAERRHLEAAR